MPTDNIEKVKEFLRNREPIFHHRDLTNTREEADNEMHKDYWEIGASGKLYTRGFILNFLEERYKNEMIDEMVTENWKITEFKVQHLAGDIYMATYILNGQNRLTRRTTLWKGNLNKGFQALYHQGTIMQQ